MAYLFGFTERLHDIRAWDRHFGSAGFGFGVETRLAHVIALDLEWRWAYRFEDREWRSDFTFIDSVP
jgi:hypothetical protein